LKLKFFSVVLNLNLWFMQGLKAGDPQKDIDDAEGTRKKNERDREGQGGGSNYFFVNQRFPSPQNL
jgi:hypothetical protein